MRERERKKDSQAKKRAMSSIKINRHIKHIWSNELSENYLKSCMSQSISRYKSFKTKHFKFEWQHFKKSELHFSAFASNQNFMVNI